MIFDDLQLRLESVRILKCLPFVEDLKLFKGTTMLLSLHLILHLTSLHFAKLKKVKTFMIKEK